MPTKKPTAAYPEEFKQNAVRLALESGKPQTAIARELGVGFSTLSKWIRQHRQTIKLIPPATPNQGSSETLEQEVRRLRRELEITRQEREILKAATKFFARENQ